MCVLLFVKFKYNVKKNYKNYFEEIENTLVIVIVLYTSIGCYLFIYISL